ncbi:MAG: ribosomal protein S18-alanine N-acetyltransferase [Oscillospiraceae bacterium]|nr:ribosomal protein S18-alanine N-acetyltransferase [Oscillospiraceae bacterium]
MKITKAEPRHLPELLRIEHENFPDPWGSDLLMRRITDPTTLFLVAEGEKTQLLGYAILQQIPPEAELQNIAIDKPARRSGIGKQLLTALLKEAKSYGITTTHLEVRASNAPAIALYKALNFHQTGLRRNYYQAPQEDALLMNHTL